MKKRSRSSTNPARRPERESGFLPLAIGTSGGVAIAALAFWFFKEQAEAVVEGRAEKYDVAVIDLVHTASSEGMTTAMKVITHLGSHAAIGTAAGITAIAMIWRKRNHDASTVIISTGGAMVLNTALKAIFQRQRPDLQRERKIRLPKSHSFPSGHSLLSAATYPIVVHHLVRNRSAATQLLAHIATFGIIGTVGFSRIYFAVHFPSDVLGGFAAGFGWLGLTSLSHTIGDRELGLDASELKIEN
ncbi:MAG TPA: phosphatase PAP2 family protein [Thermoanaerobaculia bacterium]|nr:phosphatase PAP2 family protein [Thermoanaerobaculia bacterium]